MKICGIKPTHDGTLTLIDNGKLIFSFEMEKLNNGFRYQEFCLNRKQIEAILNDFGYSMNQIDKWVLDGWRGTKLGERCIKKDITFFDGAKFDLELANYGHFVKKDTNLLASTSINIDQINFKYESFLHVTGHVFGAYCTSPFAVRQEDSYILVWDGGMLPQLFYYHYKDNTVTNLGPLFFLFGMIYVDLPHKFKPFAYGEKSVLSLAGKVMAYLAIGKSKKSIISAYHQIYQEITSEIDVDTLEPSEVDNMTQDFAKLARKYATTMKEKDENMITSMHFFLQELLLKNLEKLLNQNPHFTKNLCFVGGSALNIKWNSEIRRSGIFDEVWIPPFPNDSGSAIGAACSVMVTNSDRRTLEWNVYSGPKLLNTSLTVNEYKSHDCSLEELAEVIYRTNEPILFLNGKAELGPRALGNRSILASAISTDMKNILNEIKIREPYRPVAPICLEKDAPKIFSPGSPDPYMLFEHKVREDWVNKVPAIVHLDGSSRLQTVNRKENKMVFDLLTYYKDISGIPLLCNTSANEKGRGFFPDVKSAMQWGRINYIWSEGVLYTTKVTFSQTSEKIEETIG